MLISVFSGGPPKGRNVPQFPFRSIVHAKLSYIYFYQGDNILISGPLSASSILFEDKNRRGEVTNYVFAKAIRSLYIFSKRTLNLNF